MGMYNTLKRRCFAVLSSRMVYNGYTMKAAMKWKRSKVSSFFKDWKTGPIYKINSYLLGYMPQQRQKFNINFKNRKDFFSYKKYLYLTGSNGKYSKWLADVVTTTSILKNYKNNLMDLYYHIYIRDGKFKYIALDKKLKDEEKDLFEFVKKKKSVILMSSNYRYFTTLEYKNNSFVVDEVSCNEKELKAFFKELLTSYRSLVISEDVKASKDFTIDGENAKIFLKVYNKNGTDPLIGEVYCSVANDHFIDNEAGLEDVGEENVLESYSVKNYRFNDYEDIKKNVFKSRLYFDEKTGKFKFYAAQDEKKVVIFKKSKSNSNIIKIMEDNYEKLQNLISEMFATIPQIELAGVQLTITDKGFKIINITNNPSYPSITYFSEDFETFLRYKYIQKRELYKQFGFKFKIFRKKVWLKLCKLFAVLCFPKGLVPYISFRWLRDMKDDFIENKNISFRTKMWAYRHGFLSYRLAQYGITKENYKNYITDFEYKWLRHIDNYYKCWFEDKITIKYIASPYNQFFPKYYYFVTLKQGENRIIPMMDCPKELGNTYDDIFKLVKKEKDIALKRDKGSHGEGFYRISWKNNKLYLNLEEATEQDVIDILSDKSNEYLITEYIKQHEVINKIYDGAVNTIRIIVYKKDGKTPTVGNAYMRFGSAKTGAVDNIGAGGMFVSVDEETGYFHDALIITDDRKIVPCSEHPDSHLPIEGYIPNWDKILKDIVEIASYLEQIEYFGFDIAVTEDGMKFPEINRYPDYMKIGKLKPESIEYLLGKLEEKKKRFGYNKRMPHKLFKFIDRREK